jgi:hypothetical protein
MNLPRSFVAVALGLAAAGSVSAVSVRMEAVTTWAENITRASSPTDWRDAQRYDARAAVSQLREWRTGLSTTGELEAGFEHTPKFTGLDARTLGANGTMRQKFGFGAFAPSVSLEAGLRARLAKFDGDDGWTATAALRGSKRLTQSWRVGLIGDWQQHYARSSIFDTRHHRVFGTVTWDLNDRWQVSHSNGRLWGDFTANASPAIWSRALSGALGTHISGYYNTVSWAPTDISGPGWITYRVHGRVSFWSLELSPALGRNTSLPLRYESLFSVNKVGVKYRQDLWSLQLLHRF